MQLAGRLRKIENTLKTSGNGKYNGFNITIWLGDEPGIFCVRGEEIDFDGTEAEVKEFIKPYQDGGAHIIWVEAPLKWAK